MTIQVSTVPEVGNSGVKTQVDRASYLASLLDLRGALPAALSWFQPERDRATTRVQEQAIPTNRDEEWRFTDLSALVQTPFQAVSSQALSASTLEPFLLPEVEICLVLVDGVYAPELSRVASLPAGVQIGSLAAIDSSLPLGDYLAKQQGAEEVFTSLNTASFSDGLVIWVPRQQQLQPPIHLLSVSTAKAPTLSHPRCLVVAEADSQMTLIEDYVTLGDSPYFTNPVTEIWVGPNAQVHHTRIQRDSSIAFHIGKTAVSQARDSHYTCTAIGLGAKLSRHHLEVYQTGEQTQTVLNGLMMVGGEQLADTHSLIAYTKPYGTSSQVQKCIVSDRGHGVFNGKIFVPQAAQLTNASQVSRNLLLSPRGRVDTKPQLEITADNVKCAHGATVSQLDGDEVFYLQSRGLDREMAQKLLVYAFAAEVVQQVPVDSLRKTLSQAVRDRQAPV